MKAAIPLVAMLAVSCAQSSQPVAGTSHMSSPTQVTSPSPAASQVPTPLPLTAVDFACRLPVSVSTPDGGHQGAFITFPSGTLTIDPNGKDGMYYDRAFSRWVPAARNAVSPDGSSYAFGSQTAAGKPLLHVISVATGADRVYSLPDDMYNMIGGTFVINFTSSAVYMGELSEGGLIGLWVLDLASGATTETPNVENIWEVDGGFGWATEFNAADSNPLSFPPGFRANQIDRIDLASGARAAWLYRPGNIVGVMGVDRAHHPIVGVVIDKDTVELLLLLDAKKQQTIYRGSSSSWIGNIDALGGGIISDSHGLWMGSGPLGLFLYTPAGVVEKVFDQGRVRPANGCS